MTPLESAKLDAAIKAKWSGTIRGTARLMGVGKDTIRARYKRLGLSLSPRHGKKVNPAEVCAAWERTRNTRAVADILGISESTAGKYLKRLGLSVCRARALSDDAIREAWDGTIAGTAAKMGRNYRLIAKRYRAAGLDLLPLVPVETQAKIVALYDKGMGMVRIRKALGITAYRVRWTLERERPGRGKRVRKPLAVEAFFPVVRGRKTLAVLAEEIGMPYGWTRKQFVARRTEVFAALGLPVVSLRGRPKKSKRDADSPCPRGNP